MAEIGTFMYISEKDAIRAKIMFDNGDFNACGKFCEQSAEKSLKAFISEHGNSSDMLLLKLHKPYRLYERCCKLGLDKISDASALILSKFSEYYYDTNYPGNDYIELTEEEAAEALKIMNEINALVKNKLENL